MSNFGDPRPPISQASARTAEAAIVSLCTERGCRVKAGLWGGDRSFHAKIEIPSTTKLSELKKLSTEIRSILEENIPGTNNRDDCNWKLSFYSEGQLAGEIRGGNLKTGPNVGEVRVDSNLDSDPNIVIDYNSVIASNVLLTTPVATALEQTRILSSKQGGGRVDAGFVENDRIFLTVEVPDAWTIKRGFEFRQELESIMRKYINKPIMRGYNNWSIAIKSGGWEIL